MSIDYAAAKFSAAVHGMATSAAPLQERLRYAHMNFIMVRTEDLEDPELVSRYEALLERLTAKGDDDVASGSVQNTTRQMSDEEAREVAQLICDLDALLHFVELDRARKLQR